MNTLPYIERFVIVGFKPKRALSYRSIMRHSTTIGFYRSPISFRLISIHTTFLRELSPHHKKLFINPRDTLHKHELSENNVSNAEIDDMECQRRTQGFLIWSNMLMTRARFKA